MDDWNSNGTSPLLPKKGRQNNKYCIYDLLYFAINKLTSCKPKAGTFLDEQVYFLSSKKVDGTTIPNTNPITEASSMEITQTFCARYHVSDLDLSLDRRERVGYLEFLKAYYTFDPNEGTSLLQTIG